MRIAVVKPDHLGDQVLASPAIRALTTQFGSDVELFCAPGVVQLAKYLYGGVTVHPMQLAHLTKSTSALNPEQTDFVSELRGFDLTIFLRNDYVTQEMVNKLGPNVIITDNDDGRHETVLHKEIITFIAGAYRRNDLFGLSYEARGAGIANNVGLCVSAGFATNRWPEIHWIELSKILVNCGKKVWLIGGPQETSSVRIIATAARIDPERVIIGDPEFSFLDKVGRLDLVVASDSGTGHMCSLKVPVISVFGSSPWRRFAPFGRWNRVVTRGVHCSPCCQFSTQVINLCISRECMELLEPQVVADVLDLPPGRVGVTRIRDCITVTGVSHLEMDD